MRSAAVAARRQVTYVLDSYAVLAYLGAEAGTPRVREILGQASKGRVRAVMSVINLGEVAYVIERERGLPEVHAALALVDQLPIEVLPAPREAVLAAAHIKAGHPLAYANAFVAAAAQALGATVVTGDPEFESLSGLLKIERI